MYFFVLVKRIVPCKAADATALVVCAYADVCCIAYVGIRIYAIPNVCYIAYVRMLTYAGSPGGGSVPCKAADATALAAAADAAPL